MKLAKFYLHHKLKYKVNVINCEPNVPSFISICRMEMIWLWNLKKLDGVSHSEIYKLALAYTAQPSDKYFFFNQGRIKMETSS